ncbi:hypothetical protein BGZ46_000137 [Entomortierella lignicola]|nr:hypothetical protein BGZ46_000137 [Entomortierella lignicola]
MPSALNIRVLGWHEDGDQYVTRIESSMFIDMDPETGLPWPWACKCSIEVLNIDIGSIPRPDLRKLDGVVAEPYSGQDLDIQSQVYERLARLTKLEILFLESCGGTQNASDDNREKDCLEISLKSGLAKLDSLKKLRVLSVLYRYTGIGVDEVRWMAEHRPNLRLICRHNSEIDSNGEDVENNSYFDNIKEWLRNIVQEYKSKI